MPGLPQALVHVSTTYSNTNHPVIEEKVYPAVADWREMIRLSETLTTEEFDRQAPQHMGYHPNTYTFTKSLAEQVINDHRDRLNVTIYRPSIGKDGNRRQARLSLFRCGFVMTSSWLQWWAQ